MFKVHNKSVYIAKTLIIISIFLFIYGIILDLNNKVKLINPVDDVKVVSSSHGGFISIDDNSNKDDFNNTTDNSNVDNNTDNSNNSNNDIQNNVYDDVDGNNILRENLKKKYNIDVKYGSETEGYSVGGLSTVSIYDSEKINSSLKKLDSLLELYPQGFFNEISNGGIPLTIYLINNYSSNEVTGATDSNYSFANISLAIIYPIDESFFHESYHYIERFILKKGLSFNSELWKKFNPSGFTYGTINGKYSYRATFSDNSYFVNNYAQVSAEEDRASTFEYMMASSKASCLNENKPVWKKAYMMSNMIDAAFETVNVKNTEYWERFL